MNTLTAIFTTMFGLVFGSFLNVCITRLPRGLSVVAPRSRCPVCAAPIIPADNIPLISWLRLRGRCRACHAPIPFRYFLVEAVTAALFLLCFLTFGLSIEGAGAALLCFLLVGLAVMDAETLLLPDPFTLPGLALGILYSGLTGSPKAASLIRGMPHLSGAASAALTALGAASAILLIRWSYWLVRRKEGMGLGDAKLLAMIGAWFGPPQTFLIFFLAVITGALYGLALMAAPGRHPKDPTRPVQSPTRVPLGAFLCASSLYALFLGGKTLAWYFSLFM